MLAAPFETLWNQNLLLQDVTKQPQNTQWLHSERQTEQHGHELGRRAHFFFLGERELSLGDTSVNSSLLETKMNPSLLHVLWGFLFLCIFLRRMQLWEQIYKKGKEKENI